MKFVLMGIHGTGLGVYAYMITWLLLSGGLLPALGTNHINYNTALKNSVIFFEAQRSGKLPINNRVNWRGDSALDDGKLANVDLVGGYYDAGDNVKYGFPLAFTITTLAWSAIAYHSELKATGELHNVRSAIGWGSNYLLKAAAQSNTLFVEVGDPDKDHECWMKPENMTTPRTVLKIDQKTPGTEIAAETSAAMAAAALVFRNVDKAHTNQLIAKAKELFNFAKTYKGTYDGECPYYCSSSGYNDELLWAATWLYIATKNSEYMTYIQDEAVSAAVSEFSWDLKYAGAQILLSQYYMAGHKELQSFKEEADHFVCAVLPDSPNHQVYISPGGYIHLRDGANSQYVTAYAFLFAAYSDILKKHKQEVVCGNKKFNSDRLMDFAKQQMDYLLGKNPKSRSYMVGFGNTPPQQAHHRGASIPKVLPTDKEINCGMSFVYWYNPDTANPNELTGAIVGGPDKNDNFIDRRINSSYTEPTTYINSMAVGVLAKLARQYHAKA